MYVWSVQAKDAKLVRGNEIENWSIHVLRFGKIAENNQKITMKPNGQKRRTKLNWITIEEGKQMFSKFQIFIDAN